MSLYLGDENRLGYVAAHEVGHLLSLRDRYHRNPKTGEFEPDKDYEHNLMSGGGDEIFRKRYRHYHPEYKIKTDQLRKAFPQALEQ